MNSTSYYREYIEYSKEEFDLLISMFFGKQFFMARILEDLCIKHEYNTRKVYNSLRNISPLMHVYSISAAMYEVKYEEIPLLINDYCFKLPLVRTALNWRLKIGK